MPYRLKLTRYVGGEVRWTSSPYSLETSTSERTTEVVQIENSGPEKTRPTLLDYSAQLETASRARLSGYGSAPIRKTRFTRAAKQTIQRCARAMDQSAASPSEILFFTGTIPGTGQDQYQAVAEWSSWVIHRLKSWVAKRVECKFDFYCWELQKRGALHLHYAVHVPDAAVRQDVQRTIKTEWIRLLDYVSAQTGVDVFQNVVRGFTHRSNTDKVQADCQEVTKSVGAYLGKYCSKSSSGENSTGVFTPCRWYGVSRPLRNLEVSFRRTLNLTFAGFAEWESAVDDLKCMLATISDCGFEWLNKVISGCGGVSYGVSLKTLEEVIFMQFNERLSYSSINSKLRDCWRNLVAHLTRIQSYQSKWFESVKRKHRVVRQWDNIRMLSGESLLTPEGIQSAQHLVWAFQDLLRDPFNTIAPRLERRLKGALIYWLHEMECAIQLRYEYDALDVDGADMVYSD